MSFSSAMKHWHVNRLFGTHTHQRNKQKAPELDWNIEKKVFDFGPFVERCVERSCQFVCFSRRIWQKFGGICFGIRWLVSISQKLQILTICRTHPHIHVQRARARANVRKELEQDVRSVNCEWSELKQQHSINISFREKKKKKNNVRLRLTDLVRVFFFLLLLLSTVSITTRFSRLPKLSSSALTFSQFRNLLSLLLLRLLPSSSLSTSSSFFFAPPFLISCPSSFCANVYWISAMCMYLKLQFFLYLFDIMAWQKKNVALARCALCVLAW